MSPSPHGWLAQADVELIEAAARALSGAFLFSQTPEGTGYWSAVQERLEEMARIAKAEGRS